MEHPARLARAFSVIPLSGIRYVLATLLVNFDFLVFADASFALPMYTPFLYARLERRIARSCLSLSMAGRYLGAYLSGILPAICNVLRKYVVHKYTDGRWTLHTDRGPATSSGIPV